MKKERFRIEQDTMGEVAVPGDKLYGAQTSRAVANFPISGSGIGRQMIWSLGVLKQVAARVNHGLGKLDSDIAGAIEAAAEEVVRGDLDDHFPVDVFQSGSGTSSNMNANEVIANRAIQILGGEVGSKTPVHPNDHVNMGQSSNDVFPSAMHLAGLSQIERDLMPALEHLHGALAKKSKEFESITKIGRTHLQDAVPLRLGQEFSGFAAQVKNGMRHVMEASAFLRELPIGGTAVGTGLNSHPQFGRLAAAEVTSITGISVTEADNHFEAQSARDAAVRVSGALKSLAISLIKVANDIRLLGSGPRLGLGELSLPAVQPGSSIMPGKVNPVIAEALIQVGAQVIGNDAAIGTGGMLGHFQLNTMQPLIARNLLEQIQLLTNGATVFADRLVVGLEPQREKITGNVEKSLGLATVLVPHIGYDSAAEIAKLAEAEGKTVRQVAKEQQAVSDDILEQLMAAYSIDADDHDDAP
jgi:fumarate hydratase class II